MNDEMPETPETLELTETPETTGAPETPEQPELTETPEPSEPSEIPDTLETPEVPATPAAREVRANYVNRASTRLLVCTPTATFEGTFHYPIAARLSDAIRMAFTSEHHFVLTDVSICDNASLAEPATRAAFICINAAHVDVVIPMGEPAADQASDPPQPPLRSVAA